MTTNGFSDFQIEPMARWMDFEDAQPSILNQRLRFPYANNVVASNRIMKSPMSELLARYCSADMQLSGIPTKSLINLYKKFGDGGFGIIVTGGINVTWNNLEAAGNVIIDKNWDSDERREAFKEWTEVTKRNGSIFIAQLFHPGSHAADLPFKTEFDVNRLTRQQIIDLINDYAYAASYAQQCGFDGVEISSAYYYALGQFITSGSNSRTDEFGGSLENRSRLLFKIIQAIRMRLRKPSSFAIGLKLFIGNFEPAFNESEFGEFIHNVEKTGFDYITITGGDFDLLTTFKPKDENPAIEYFYQQFALNVKRNLTRTKLFMNHGFVTVSEMCDAVSSGWADGISIGRPAAAEPDLARKILQNEVKGATKSLFDPLDFPVEKQFVGSQLWQQGMDMRVMDASNPYHVEQFKKELHLHEKQRRSGGLLDELVTGYPRAIISEPSNNELTPSTYESTKHEGAVPIAGNYVPLEDVQDHASLGSIQDHAQLGSVQDHASLESVQDYASTENVEDYALLESTGYHAPAGSAEDHAPLESAEYHAPAESVEDHAPAESVEDHAPLESAEYHAPTESTEYHAETKFEDALEHVEAYDDSARIAAEAMYNASLDLMHENGAKHGEYGDHVEHTPIAKDVKDAFIIDEKFEHPMQFEEARIELGELTAPEVATKTERGIPVVSGLTGDNQMIVSGVSEKRADEDTPTQTFPEIHVVHSGPQVIDDESYNVDHPSSGAQTQSDIADAYGGFATPDEEKHAEVRFQDTKQIQDASSEHTGHTYDVSTHSVPKSFDTQFDDNFDDTTKYFVTEHHEGPIEIHEDDGYKVSKTLTTTTTTLFGTSAPEGGETHHTYETHYELHSDPSYTDELHLHHTAVGEAALIHSEHPDDKSRSHGLAGFISSALPDSVQSLFSTIKKNKKDETGDESDSDDKHWPIAEVHEEHYSNQEHKYDAQSTATKTAYEMKEVFGEPGAKLDFEHRSGLKPEIGQESSHVGLTEEEYSVSGNAPEEKSKQHSSKTHHRLFGHKKSNDDLDFEFIH